MRWISPLLIAVLIAGCSGDDTQQAAQSPSAQDGAGAASTTGESPAVVQASGAEPAESGETAESTTGAASVPVVTAEQVLVRVDLLIDQRQFNQAVALLNQLIAQKNDVPDAYLKRSAIWAEAKLYTRAIDDMSSAIALLPQNARLRNTRGYFYLSRNDPGDLDQAMTDFDDAIGLDLEYHQPYNNRGLVRITREDFEGALLDFDAALRIDPDYLDALNNRGFALMRLERFDDAIGDFTTVINKNADYVNAWNNRGLALANTERHEAAVYDFTKAIELQPGNLKYYLHRSASYEALGRVDEAQADQAMVTWIGKIAELNRAIGQDQHDASAWVARGRHFMKIERFDDALADFNRALAEDPDSSEAHLGLAEMWRAQGDVELAVAEATQAIQLATADTTRAVQRRTSHAAFSLRGDIHFDQGDFESAVADYESARRFDSQVVLAYRHCSEQLREAGDVERASALLERATQIESSIQSGTEPAASDEAGAGADQSAAVTDETTTQ